MKRRIPDLLIRAIFGLVAILLVFICGDAVDWFVQNVHILPASIVKLIGGLIGILVLLIIYKLFSKFFIVAENESNDDQPDLE